MVEEDVTPHADAVGTADDDATPVADPGKLPPLKVVFDGLTQGAEQRAWRAEQRCESSHASILACAGARPLVTRD